MSAFYGLTARVELMLTSREKQYLKCRMNFLAVLSATEITNPGARGVLSEAVEQSKGHLGYILSDSKKSPAIQSECLTE